MMIDYKKSALIGDANRERASLLKEIIEQEFLTTVELVETLNQIDGRVFDARVAISRWKLVLMAEDLPRSFTDLSSIFPDDFSHISKFSSVWRLGCIHSSIDPPDLTGVSFYPFYIRVPLPGCAANREAVVENIVKEPRTGLTRAPRRPEIELEDDPILREQVLDMSNERDLSRAKEVLGYLIRDFNTNNCDTVKVLKLVQGASGAKVFRFRPKLDDLGLEERVIKIGSHDKKWKLAAEVERHNQARKTLENRYRKCIPELQKPRFPGESAPQYIVSHKGWCAICYDFLGGEAFGRGRQQFGRFMDLEMALVGTWEELRNKTAATNFATHFDDRLFLDVGRKHVLETLLEWLCKNWYMKRARRESAKRMWDYQDGPDDDFTAFPPYQLAARSKRYILSFLDGRQARMGKRFFGDLWSNHHHRVREFVASSEDELSKIYNLGQRMHIVVSPAHGDLNSNNILLWLDEAHPFLIDFPFYQESGHALQDFARLEVEIKFTLMDRQEDYPPEKLPAYDYTHSQMPLWLSLENHLMKEDWAKCPLTLPAAGFFEDSIRLSWELVLLLRTRAREVQAQDKQGKTGPSFWREYRPALLYHTLRAIGYDSLSPFKRILAVYSAAELLMQCRRR